MRVERGVGEVTLAAGALVVPVLLVTPASAPLNILDGHLLLFQFRGHIDYGVTHNQMDKEFPDSLIPKGRSSSTIHLRTLTQTQILNKLKDITKHPHLEAPKTLKSHSNYLTQKTNLTVTKPYYYYTREVPQSSKPHAFLRRKAGTHVGILSSKRESELQAQNQMLSGTDSNLVRIRNKNNSFDSSDTARRESLEGRKSQVGLASDVPINDVEKLVMMVNNVSNRLSRVKKVERKKTIKIVMRSLENRVSRDSDSASRGWGSFKKNKVLEDGEKQIATLLSRLERGSFRDSKMSSGTINFDEIKEQEEVEEMLNAELKKTFFGHDDKRIAHKLKVIMTRSPYSQKFSGKIDKIIRNINEPMPSPPKGKKNVSGKSILLDQEFFNKSLLNRFSTQSKLTSDIKPGKLQQIRSRQEVVQKLTEESFESEPENKENDPVEQLITPLENYRTIIAPSIQGGLRTQEAPSSTPVMRYAQGKQMSQSVRNNANKEYVNKWVHRSNGNSKLLYSEGTFFPFPLPSKNTSGVASPNDNSPEKSQADQKIKVSANEEISSSLIERVQARKGKKRFARVIKDRELYSLQGFFPTKDSAKSGALSRHMLSQLARSFKSGSDWSLEEVKREIISLLVESEEAEELKDLHAEFLTIQERVERAHRVSVFESYPKQHQIESISSSINNIYDHIFEQVIHIQEPHIQPIQILDVLVQCIRQNEPFESESSNTLASQQQPITRPSSPCGPDQEFIKKEETAALRQHRVPHEGKYSLFCFSSDLRIEK